MRYGKTHTTREIIKNIGERRTKFGPNGIVDEVKPCTVLWITHRRSFANDLYKNFLQIGFKSYLEKEHKPELYKHDRVVCSFESLHFLLRDGAMKKFDLVVLDETESLLAHFESPTMKEKREAYNQLMIYLTHAKKILSLDADFGIRSCWFLKTIAQVKIIVKNWNQSPRTFRIMDQEIRFMELLEHDLSISKRVVVVTMPSKKGEQVIEETKSLAENRESINISLHNSGPKCLLNANRWSRGKA